MPRRLEVSDLLGWNLSSLCRDKVIIIVVYALELELAASCLNYAGSGGPYVEGYLPGGLLKAG